MTPGFLISIPIPPSVNAMYANRKGGAGRGRYKTEAYKAWIDEAGWVVNPQRPAPVRGKFKFFLKLPKIRGDVDNRIKACLDLLVSLKLVDDDRHCIHAQAVIDDERKGFAIVAVEGVA